VNTPFLFKVCIIMLNIAILFYMKKVCVIGGGPAGMMSAGKSAENGADVILVEKNNRLGVKLLITGKGRCNITNAENNPRNLTEKFGVNGKFMFSALSRFSVEDVINFFESRGLKTKVERGARIFPDTDKSQDVLEVLKDYLIENKVKVLLNSEVKSIIGKKKIEKIVLTNGKEIIADEYIICTGGKSYPETGSNGAIFNLLKKLGHQIVKLAPALVPIICPEKFVKDLEGLSLKNVDISIWQNNKKKISRFGEAIFTNVGLSGPIILDMSKEVGQILEQGATQLKIDFKPALTEIELDKRIQKDWQTFTNKDFKNSLDSLLPQKLIPVIIKLSNIDPNKKVNSITKEERKTLLKLLKALELNIINLDGFDKAIITTGGVKLTEVDPKTMRSKIVSNLFLAGEVLDLDGPTGGYNLQVAWSTGFVAGDNINN